MIEIFMAVCLTSCGDTHATSEASTGEARLEFTNEGYQVCELPPDLEKSCPPGKEDEPWYCTFEVTSSLTLNRPSPEPPCRYRGRLNVAASNVTIDCRGAIIEGEHAPPLTADGEDENPGGIRIGSSDGSDFENITVKNCNLQNFRVGIGVQNSEQDYDKSPKNVRLENVHVKNSNATGIYIYQYVEGVVITNSRVEGSADLGIHLSHDSRGTRVEHSRVFLNGKRAPQGVPNLGLSPREGMAIDGSSENEIVYSEFDGNAAGGIFLYSNCGEEGRPQRPEAKGNLIFRNVFKNSPRAIWVASRQSRNLSTHHCDPTIDADTPAEEFRTPYAYTPNANPVGCDQPTAANPCTWNVLYPHNPECACRAAVSCSAAATAVCDFEQENGAYFHDAVDDTVISKNVFHSLVKYGCSPSLTGKHCINPDTTIRVEDDNTDIWKNAFVGYSAGELVRIGTPLRYYHLSQPVTGAVVDGNGYLDMSQATFDAHVKYGYGSRAPINPLPTRTEKACRQGDKVVPPHSSETFYQHASGTVCVSEERSCRNGVLSGSFTHASCAVTPP